MSELLSRLEKCVLRLDRMGMAVSVEGRAPLLDQEVVDLARSWPASDLVENGAGKAPLRRLARSLYPRAILERPKMGFCAPTRSWLRNGLRDVAVEALEGLADEIGIFDGAGLARWVRPSPATARDAGRMWTLVSLSRWWRRMRRAAPETVLR